MEMSGFFGHNIAGGSGGGGGGGRPNKPNPKKKLSLGAGSYVTIACKGFFTQSQVLLSSIVVEFLIYLSKDDERIMTAQNCNA